MFSVVSVGTIIGEGGGVGESGKGSELLNVRFNVPPPEGTVHVAARIERIIFSNPSLDTDDPQFRTTVDALVKDIQAFPLVVSAFSYYDSNDSILLADDRHAILAIVRSEDPDVASGDDIDIQSILVAVNEAGNAADGFEIEIVSTRLIEEQIEVIFEKDFQRVMVISLVFGLGILLLAFRALVAAVIPLVMAIFAIITALGVVAVVSQTYAFAESYREVLILMGLAVGIDYSLFVMSRFLNERAGGRPKLEAIAVASNTTGRAVVYVAGDTADGIDFEKRVSTAAPLVFSFVLGFSFLLLLLMFRSIVIAIKAITLNLLSVAAVYGVLVMVFQWGWGISILGSEETGIIEAWLPLFLFGILFGLSMDYHMLLLNRIKEFHDGGASNEESVSQGIKITAGQITSAAAIMVGVFGAFATSRVLPLQQFGLGLGVAVLIDATVIRVVLLPATMKLLGEWNWYMPSWLNWLPKITQEESHPLIAPQASSVDPS